MTQVLSYYTGGNVAQTQAAKRSALRDLERKHEAEIRAAIRDLKGIKVRALRIEKRTTIKSMRAEHKRMIEEVRGRFDSKIAALLAEAETKKLDLAGSKLARKHNKQREKGRATGTEKRQELDEQVENDVRHWRPELVPLWRKVRVGFANRPGMSRFEAFQHYVHETPDAVARIQEEQELVNETDLLCQEAKHLGSRGDPQMQAWAEENCGMPVSRVRPKPKGTPAQRTASLYATGERPPESGSKGAKGAKEKRQKTGKKAPKGQAGFSVGRLGAASLIDTPLDQIPF